ncbi:MAG: NUDIX hydrolase [Gammaproteobacteria bacterium]|nr:NUDIX hydrolase [Gammaproteobacteria bacterium]
MSRDTHVTVAVVVEQDGRFLLVEERVGGQLVLNQPAGHWEDGESFAQGAVREALEETGWHVQPTHLLGVYEYRPDDLTYCFLRLAFVARPLRHDAQRPLDKGIERAVWMSRADIAACPARHRSPMVLRCVDDYLAGRRYPLDMLAHLNL